MGEWERGVGRGGVFSLGGGGWPGIKRRRQPGRVVGSGKGGKFWGAGRPCQAGRCFPPGGGRLVGNKKRESPGSGSRCWEGESLGAWRGLVGRGGVFPLGGRLAGNKKKEATGPDSRRWKGQGSFFGGAGRGTGRGGVFLLGGTKKKRWGDGVAGGEAGKLGDTKSPALGRGLVFSGHSAGWGAGGGWLVI